MALDHRNVIIKKRFESTIQLVGFPSATLVFGLVEDSCLEPVMAVVLFGFVFYDDVRESLEYCCLL
jgi:hypothetical protein